MPERTYSILVVEDDPAVRNLVSTALESRCYRHTAVATGKAAIASAAASDPAKFVEVEACYDSTWDLGFVSDSMEVLRQNRQGQIADMRNAQKDILEDAKILIEDGDTAKAVSTLKNYAGAFLLRPSDAAEWKKIAAFDVPESKPEAQPEAQGEASAK